MGQGWWFGSSHDGWMSALINDRSDHLSLPAASKRSSTEARAATTTADILHDTEFGSLLESSDFSSTS